MLAKTPATPNQVSAVSFLMAGGVLYLFAAGAPIWAGLLAQTCSIVDGVDGDLARFKNMASRFGGFLDAVLDRYTDAIILLGLTIWAASASDGLLPWAAGFAALSGSFVVTYTRARIEDSRRTMFDRGLSSLASRDVRLLVVMIGAIAGQWEPIAGTATLLVLAALTNAIVVVRLVAARAALRED